jgi:short-subunit dehydrogenase
MKTAVVTGASSGLGKSISEMLLKNDFKVYGVSRTEPVIENINFIWIKADLSKNESFDLIGSLIVEDKVDLLVNDAGVVFAENSLDFHDNTFEKTFAINLVAPIKLTSKLKSKLDRGTVVNISSTSDRFVDEGLASYCASKTALDVYFDAVALENKNIKVLDILPVYIDTPMLHDIAEKLKFTYNTATKPEIVAEAMKEIIFSNQNLESGTRVIVLSNESLDDTEESEKLWYYNVDTKEMKKLK